MHSYGDFEKNKYPEVEIQTNETPPFSLNFWTRITSLMVINFKFLLLLSLLGCTTLRFINILKKPFMLSNIGT